jgi:hypothetical protein
VLYAYSTVTPPNENTSEKKKNYTLLVVLGVIGLGAFVYYKLKKQ